MRSYHKHFARLMRAHTQSSTAKKLRKEVMTLDLDDVEGAGVAQQKFDNMYSLWRTDSNHIINNNYTQSPYLESHHL